MYCRVLSIFPTIFILIPEYYGHHTGFIHCSFDWSPKDDHIFDGGLPKADHSLKAPQPILQQNMEKLLTILFDHYRNPLLSPPGGLFFSSTFEGGLFNLAKRITCSKNTLVRDRVDLRVVQLKSLSKGFNSVTKTKFLFLKMCFWPHVLR